MDEILICFENQAQEHGTFNCDEQRREDTCDNSKNYTQQSNMQEHNENWIPTNSKQKGNLKHIPVHMNGDKPDENTKTYTQYGRLVKKPDRLTYH